MSKSFAERLLEATDELGPVCVGIDPILEHIPQHFMDSAPFTLGPTGQSIDAMSRFCLDALRQIQGVVPVVKFQMAYFERWGWRGMRELAELTYQADNLGFIVILDGKRGDIGPTSQAYADAYLGKDRQMYCDALTVAPYMGEDSIKPFVDTARENGKGIFVLVRTSNPGGDYVQGFGEGVEAGGAKHKPLYRAVAGMIDVMNAHEAFMAAGGCSYTERSWGSVGAVVGATNPEEAAILRDCMPNTLFLVPGYGAQGGGLDGVRACFRNGRGAVVNSSRAVLYPEKFSSNKDDTIRDAAKRFQEEICNALP